MTLLDLQEVLGNRIEVCKCGENTKQETEKSMVILSIAKQMINNANVILRTDKLSHRMDRCNYITGEIKECSPIPKK